MDFELSSCNLDLITQTWAIEQALRYLLLFYLIRCVFFLFIYCSRYDKQFQEVELSLQQQRRRLYQEVAEEKERLAQLAARQRAEGEDLRRHLEENSSVAVRALREELDKSREEQEKRHQVRSDVIADVITDVSKL